MHSAFSQAGRDGLGEGEKDAENLTFFAGYIPIRAFFQTGYGKEFNRINAVRGSYTQTGNGAVSLAVYG